MIGNVDTDCIGDNSRQRATSKLAWTDCETSYEGGTLCEYGRCCRSSKPDKEKDWSTNGTVIRQEHRRLNLYQREDSFKSKFRRRIMSTGFVFIALFCGLLVCEARTSAKGTQPRLSGKAKVKLAASVGEHVVLRCPVTALPPPLTKWSVNGRHILGLKPRFKVGFDLRIRGVRASDAGRYRCTARNAFGVVDHEINLSVIDSEGKPSPSKPRFSVPDKMRRRSIVKPVGRSLRLHCRASGYPTPKVEWYKDGNLTSPQDDRHPHWSYTIRPLDTRDGGRYRCRVWNSEGEISYTYEVRVVGKLRERPVLLEPHPMNTTVHIGGMTAIQCRVQSRVEPTVKWIKRLDDDDVTAYGGDIPKSVITIDDRHYMILPTQEMLHLKSGPYLNKLVIRGATEKHAGMYICLAANTMGYNFKYAYLNVVSGPVNTSLRSSASTPRTKLLPGSRSGQGSLSLPAIIGVPAGIGLILVVFLAWVCQRRREQRLESAPVVASGLGRLTALGGSDTKPSTRSTIGPRADGIGNADSPQDGVAEHGQIDGGRNNDSYYTFYHRPPPTSGTPLLTVNEPEFESTAAEDDGYAIPAPPPCSEVAGSCLGSENRLPCGLGPPPPPPPSQKSASSLSSRADRKPRFPHHFHYMHPPGGARRHHYHPHLSGSGRRHYGYSNP